MGGTFFYYMKIPDFSLPASNGKTYNASDFARGITILYLYPKDMTSGCTLEAHDFQEAIPKFKDMGIQVVGLSKDPLKSHAKFCEKEGLNFPLISDEYHDLIDALDAWKEKSMYGKKYWGTERSTFVIQDGKIIKEWRNVKVPGHVEEVLSWAQEHIS